MQNNRLPPGNFLRAEPESKSLFLDKKGQYVESKRCSLPSQAGRSDTVRRRWPGNVPLACCGGGEPMAASPPGDRKSWSAARRGHRRPGTNKLPARSDKAAGPNNPEEPKRPVSVTLRQAVNIRLRRARRNRFGGEYGALGMYHPTPGARVCLFNSFPSLSISIPVLPIRPRLSWASSTSEGTPELTPFSLFRRALREVVPRYFRVASTKTN